METEKYTVSPEIIDFISQLRKMKKWFNIYYENVTENNLVEDFSFMLKIETDLCSLADHFSEVLKKEFLYSLYWEGDFIKKLRGTN